MTGSRISPLAGKAVAPSRLINVSRLINAYFSGAPDLSQASQRIHFGTSGHRGSAFDNTSNEPHVLAITQAICLYRTSCGIHGPLFIGFDTHALSRPAFITASEVFAANGVTTMIDHRDAYTPTPAISHAILTYNRTGRGGAADGVVITPSHNPPEDGGFKYNPPTLSHGRYGQEPIKPQLDGLTSRRDYNCNASPFPPHGTGPPGGDRGLRPLGCEVRSGDCGSPWLPLARVRRCRSHLHIAFSR